MSKKMDGKPPTYDPPPFERGSRWGISCSSGSAQGGARTCAHPCTPARIMHQHIRLHASASEHLPAHVPTYAHTLAQGLALSRRYSYKLLGMAGASW